RGGAHAPFIFVLAEGSFQVRCASSIAAYPRRVEPQTRHGAVWSFQQQVVTLRTIHGLPDEGRTGAVAPLRGREQGHLGSAARRRGRLARGETLGKLRRVKLKGRRGREDRVGWERVVDECGGKVHITSQTGEHTLFAQENLSLTIARWIAAWVGKKL